MASMLTCEICLEKKSGRKPKSLSCLHSFCRECLASWADTRAPRGIIECPVCRQETKIPARGIDGLVDDFKVLQLEEMIKAIGDPFLCQGCLLKGQSSKAKVKCLTCDRRLCESCLQYHSSERIFEKHRVATELCEVHGNEISHVCITCFTGLCIDCILSEVHQGHNKYEHEEGIDLLLDSVKKKQKEFTEMRRQTKVREKIIAEKTIKSMEINIEKIKLSGSAMKEEIDRQVAKVNKGYRNQIMQDLKTALKKIKMQHPNSSFDELEQNDIADENRNLKKIIDFNTELNKRIRSIRDDEEDVLEISVKQDINKTLLMESSEPLLLHQYYDKLRSSLSDLKVGETLFRNVSVSPKLVLEKLSEASDNIGLPRSMEGMNDCTVLVAFDDHENVVRFDQNGQIVAYYHCDGSGQEKKVNRLAVGDGNIYILCSDDKTLLRFTAGCFSKKVTYINTIPSDICSVHCNPINNTLIFSQKAPDGRVFCLRESIWRENVSNLASGHIRAIPHAGSWKFVVAAREGNKVLVYDEHENLLYTLTGCGYDDPFHHPTDVTMLNHDTLLVADQENHRLCKFKLADGSFEGLLLTAVDGICFPRYIVSKHPYLWVTGKWEDKDGRLQGSLQLYKWL